jgi:transcriptional regulator with XRE-family HTH domain
MSLYERIKDLCDQKGIGVTRLALDLGFAKNYFTKVSRGSDITSERLEQIADYFNVTTDYLIKGDESKRWYINEETAKLAQELLENEDRRILLDASRDLTPEELKAMVAMVDAFGKK